MLDYHLVATIDAQTIKPQTGPLHRVSISPDGKWLALSAADAVVLVGLSKYQARHIIRCGIEKVDDVIWAPDGRIICTRGTELAVIDVSLVDRNSQIVVSGYPLKMKNLKCIAVVETGGDMCIAVGGEDVVQLVICSKSGWRTVGTVNHPPPTAFSGVQPVNITSLSWYKESEGELTLVVSYVYHGVVGWKISLERHEDFSELSWTIATDKCRKCAVSQDGSKIVVGKEGEGFHLYSRGTAAQIRQFSIPAESSGESTPVRFIHGDHFVAGGSEAGEVRLWDVDSGDRIQTLRDAAGSIVDIFAYHRLEDNEDEDIFVVVGATQDAVYIWKGQEDSGGL